MNEWMLILTLTKWTPAKYIKTKGETNKIKYEGFN